MEKLYQKIALTDDEFNKWLIELGLLHRRMTCVCGSEMVIKKAKEGERYEHGVVMNTIVEKKSYLAGTFLVVHI